MMINAIHKSAFWRGNVWPWLMAFGLICNSIALIGGIITKGFSPAYYIWNAGMIIFDIIVLLFFPTD
jgi:hypothetical protein